MDKLAKRIQILRNVCVFMDKTGRFANETRKSSDIYKMYKIGKSPLKAVKLF